MNKTKRKLIFLWTYLEWGGAQVYMLAIMKEAMADWDIVVALPRKSSPEIIRYLDQIGVKHDLLDFYLDTAPGRTLGRKIRRQLTRVRVELGTLKYLRRHRLRDSILHLEIHPWQSWIFLTILSLVGANVFITMHNAPSTIPGWREVVWKMRMQFLSRLRGFHLFASNKDAKAKIKHLVAPTFWEEIPVTYTAVNPLQIEGVLRKGPNPHELRRAHEIGDDFVVLCVGQFIDRKGRWVFLDAARIVARTRQDILFIWVGPNKLSDAEVRKVDEYALGDRFRFILSDSIGIEREQILAFFRVADVFALPSYVEGLPIALLEAMALGLPCISTNVYAIPEAIKHNETGVLIEAGDSKALAAEVERLTGDAGLRRRLGERASEVAVSQFDERAASQTAIVAYRKCFPG